MTAATLADPATEVRRLRKELAAAVQQLEQLRVLVAMPDPMATPEYWRSLLADAHRADLADVYRQGREDMAREYEREWAMIATPIARGGAAFAVLELRRWGPGGREHFSDPRSGDFPGRGEVA